MQVKNNRYSLFVLLLFLAAYPAISTDLYLPSLPAMEQYFHVGHSAVQMTLTAYLLAFSLSLLFFGPLSDKIGRKPVLLLGSAIFSIASLLSIYASSINILIFLRIIQAFGACSAIILVYAIVRDLFSGRQAAAWLALVSMVMNSAVAFAPAVGGALQQAFGWKSDFVALSIFSAIVFFCILLFFRETIAEKTKHSLQLNHLLANYWQVLSSKVFTVSMLVVVLSFSSYFIFLYVSPFLYINVFKTSAETYGLLFLFPAYAYVLGGAIASYLNKNQGIYFTVRLGSILFLFGGLLMAMNVFLAAHYLVLTITFSMTMCSLGISIIVPSGVASALTPFSTAIGSASSMTGFLQFVVASAAGSFASMLSNISVLPMATLILICAIACLMVCLLAGKLFQQVHD